MRARILVTGGSGFLGHALKQVCPTAVYLTRQDGDLTDLNETRRLFEAFRPKRVIHLAAEVGGIKKNADRNADLFTANVRINTNVLTAAHEQKVSRLISILSSCSFRFYADRPSTEEDLHVGLPFGGNLGYGYAKRMLDIQTRLFWEQYGCRYSSITPVTMFGPNDNWDLEEGHVAASLIHKSFLAKQQGKALEVWGSGQAVRQFVYSLDVARLLIRALEIWWGPETVIVSPDSGISIAHLAKRITGAVKFEGSLVFNTGKPEGERVRILESGTFSRHFPDFVFTPLDEGLKASAEWFSHHHEHAPANADIR